MRAKRPLRATSSYGSHPIYMEHRFNTTTNKAQSHGVFLFKYAFSSSRS